MNLKIIASESEVENEHGGNDNPETMRMSTHRQ